MITRSLNQLEVTSDIIIYLADIYKNVGKQELYEQEMKDDIKLKMLLTAEKDTFYIAKLLELNITDKRLEHIISNLKIKRKNKSENVVTNVKTAILNIYNGYENFPLYNATIQSFYSEIFGEIFSLKFNEKTKKQNSLKNEYSSNIDEADQVLEILRSNFNKKEYESLLLSIVAFIDFYNSEIYSKKHDVLSLLFLYIILLKNDIKVFRYVSMFEYIYNNQNEFKKALLDISMYKDESIVKPLEMQRFMLKMIDSSYKEFDEFILNRRFDKQYNKTHNIVFTIFKLPEVFKKSDIKHQLPLISEVTINKTLHILHEREIIKPIGRGRSASWMRLVTHTEGFDFDSIADIKLSDLSKNK